MKNTLHTVLGASGAVGRAVIQELQRRELPYRAVGRSRKTMETHFANLLNPEETKAAIEGSGYVYLCIGLPYNAKIWLRDWPVVMQIVIAACEQSQAKLIFLDNVYMYGPAPLSVPFDESHPQKPDSRKGQARKQTADLLLQAIAEERVEGVIGRAADFYGPHAVNSPFYISFLERMLLAKSPQSVSSKGIRHTYAYTSDIGRALVALALDPACYGQVWHLPVGNAVTMDEIVAIFNQHLGTQYAVSYLPAWLRTFLGLFVPPLRDVSEMIYQYETEYEMSCEKFRQHFPDFNITPYELGIQEMIASFRAEPPS